MKRLTTDYDLGDFVQAGGLMVRTKTGEITVQVKSVQNAGKSHFPPARRQG